MADSVFHLLYRDIPLFNFREACFICAEHCEIEADKKNPGRYKNPGFMSRTADRGKSESGIQRKSFKEVLLEVKGSCLSCY